MSHGDPVVVRTAATPAQAKVFVALLQAEGIRAFVDGDSLVDEVAASRRLMNLLGVQVQVPAADKERALELLANASVDDAELEAQALAAEGAEVAPVPRAEVKKGNGAVRWAVVATIAAVLFFSLWMGRLDRSARAQDYWQSRMAAEKSDDGPIPGGVRRHDPKTGEVTDAFDRDGDGNIEEMIMRTADGKTKEIVKLDGTGRVLESERWRGDVHCRVRYEGGEPQEIMILDPDGAEVKRQRWDGRNGYVDVTR